MKEDEKNKHNAVLSQDELRRMRRLSLLKLGAMGVLTAIIIILGSLSWFTMSREVEGSGVQMTATGDMFSIGSDGNTVGSYDNAYWNQAVQAAGCTGAETWMLSSDSNMRNFQVENLKEEDRGIKPGTYGKISFRLYPNQSLRAAFDYRIFAFTVQYNSAGQEIENSFALQDDTTINQLLNGHILLFTDRTGNETNGYQYNGLVTSAADFHRKTTVMTYAASSEGQEIELFWVWPETLAQVILSADNVNLRGRKTIATSELRNYFHEHPEYFLLNCPIADLNVLKVTNANVEEIIDESYSKYSKMYNEADQSIGTSVNYILLDMNVDTSAQ